MIMTIGEVIVINNFFIGVAHVMIFRLGQVPVVYLVVVRCCSTACEYT